MRKLTMFVVLLMLSVVLVACGGEDEEPEPTAAPTDAPVSTRIVESSPDPTDVAVDDEDDVATPTSVAATPAADDAMPAVVATPATEVAMQVASPEMVPGRSVGTPVVTPLVTPEASPVVSDSTPLATPGASPVPTGLNEPPVRIEMIGKVTLEGRENEAYVMTSEGCVGLGNYSGLHADRQVVIRNEAGTIVSVTSLDASDESGCVWSFVAAVPESEFYSVSIPMMFEQVFPKAQVGSNDGAVEIVLP